MALGTGNMFRAHRTTQERRLNCDPDHKAHVRGKRRPKQLPSLYDDVFRSSAQRSWKHHRRTQYRAVLDG